MDIWDDPPKRNVFVLFCQWGRPFYKFHLRKRRNICKWRPSPFNEENEWETSWLQNWIERCSFKCSIPFITRISYFWNDTKPIKLYHLISFGCKDESEKQSEINIPWRISYIFSFSYLIKQLHLPFLSRVQLDSQPCL